MKGRINVQCHYSAVLRNEMHRIPFFLKYYRDIGVDHFFFIDNGSSDGFIEFAEQQPDCSIWYTEKQL